jgi:hypothetical protein
MLRSPFQDNAPSERKQTPAAHSVVSSPRAPPERRMDFRLEMSHTFSVETQDAQTARDDSWKSDEIWCHAVPVGRI